jgi:hypothetical protein
MGLDGIGSQALRLLHKPTRRGFSFGLPLSTYYTSYYYVLAVDVLALLFHLLLHDVWVLPGIAVHSPSSCPIDRLPIAGCSLLSGHCSVAECEYAVVDHSLTLTYVASTAWLCSALIIPFQRRSAECLWGDNGPRPRQPQGPPSSSRVHRSHIIWQSPGLGHHYSCGVSQSWTLRTMLQPAHNSSSSSS